MKNSHIPQLDSVRAFAIIPVVIYHLVRPLAPGGFIGVDLFFVLSGYLITGILLREYAVAGRVDLKNFYWRRALRLFPALLAFLAVSLLIQFWSFGASRRELSQLLLREGMALSYLSNWFAAHDPGSLGPLLFTWSLSVEEQFYLIWPVCLLALLRRARVSVTKVALAAILFVQLERAAIFFAGIDGSRIYYGTDTRADALLAGCLLAVVGAERVASKAGTVLAAGVLCAQVALLEFGSSFALLGAPFVTAVAGALFVAGAERSSWRIFRARPLVWTGRVSYGISTLR